MKASPGSFAIILLSACSSDRLDVSNVIERDSAGIRIVESTKPSWREGEGWRVSSMPVVQIGTVEGDEPAQLFRVKDVARLGNGRIVVVNSGTNELRMYSATGQYLRTIGRKGDGPGEFNDPQRVWLLPADTLIVRDFTRVTYFDSAGTFVRSDSYGPWTVQDRFSDGAFLRLVIPPGKDPFLPGYSRPEHAIVRSVADNSAADTFAYVTGDEMFRSVSDFGGTSSWYAPFGAVRQAALHGDSIYTGDGATFEVWDLDERGTPVRIIRRSGERTPVTASAIESLEAELLKGTQTDAQRRRRLRLFGEWIYPPYQPAYDRLLVDHESNIWARHYTVGANPSHWTVFDSAGHWLGVVDMPGGFTVKAIGPDYILGVSVDDQGVEYVQLYGLEKPGRGAAQH